MLAIGETYFLWLLIIKYGKTEQVQKWILVFFALGIILNQLLEYNDERWYLNIQSTFIFGAFPWFLLGYHIHEVSVHFDLCEKYKKSSFIIMAVIGGFACVVQSVYDFPNIIRSVGTILYAFGLFLLTLDNPGKSMCRTIEYIGEKLSLYIYVLHVLVDAVVGFGLRNILDIDTNSKVYLWLRPIIVLIATIIVSWTIYILLIKFETHKRGKLSCE